MKSFSGHLWYLNEILVGFTFFDSAVSLEVKSVMVKALDKNTTDHPQCTAFNPTISLKQLSDFVSQHTKQLFTALNIPQQFPMNSPDTWSNDNDYIVGQRKVRSLKVVNDAAERGVALIQAFSGVLTNQEEQKQFLLQVVKKHCCDFQNCNKSTLTTVTAAAVEATSTSSDN